jgi:hypothetical protein
MIFGCTMLCGGFFRGSDAQGGDGGGRVGRIV